MRYLITFTDNSNKPFFTEWFEIENNYTDNMIVYDIENCRFFEGESWEDISLDHL